MRATSRHLGRRVEVLHIHARDRLLTFQIPEPYSFMRRSSSDGAVVRLCGAKMPAPKPSSDPLYKLLRDEEVPAFNKKREPGRSYDFRGCSFRGSDLRGLDANGLDLRDCYFRDADLRGVDLRQALLEGASLGSAKISGAFFPDDIGAEEIRLSVELGTRLRARKDTPG
jgi:Pentapeptide repeats (8 copies)